MIDEKLSKAEDALWSALAHGPQTFGDLWPRANEAVVDFRGDHHAPGYRLTDRWLQRGRRKGWMRVTRIGSKSVWSLTDTGRAALQKDEPHDRAMLSAAGDKE